MRSLILSLLVSFGAGSLGHATTLEFAMTGTYYKNNKEIQIDIAKLNQDLAKRGLAGLPELVVVRKNAKPYGKLLLKRIEAAQTSMKEKLFFPIDTGYFHEYPAICYRGEAADVPAIIKGMLGTFLTDEQGILAIRYGSTTIIDDENFKSEAALNEAYEGGNRETKVWLNYNTASNTVLVMSNLGPQGDGLELYATAIKPCR